MPWIHSSIILNCVLQQSDWCVFFFPPQSVAHVEAYIDFSEDENIEENIMDVVKNQLENLKNSIQVHL